MNELHMSKKEKKRLKKLLFLAIEKELLRIRYDRDAAMNLQGIAAVSEELRLV